MGGQAAFRTGKNRGRADRRDEEGVEAGVNAFLMQQNLAEFVRNAWSSVEPSDDLVWGWHLDLFCEALERVYEPGNGVRKLVIAAPPRHTKSDIVSVLWPAWVWTFDPSFRWLYAAYGEDLAGRDAQKMRELVKSDWYQARWEGDVVPNEERWAKMEFAVTDGGARVTTSVGGKGTGFGGDAVVVDDPLDADAARSETIREETRLWWDEKMSSRVNDPATSRKVVCGQRLHPGDLVGDLIKRPGWDVIQLPAEYEEDLSIVTLDGLDDPRTTEGEPLHPERWGTAELEDLKEELGTQFAIRAQLQQDPQTREGGPFDRGDFNVVDRDEVPWHKEIAVRVVAIDKAGTPESDASPSTSYTAMVALLITEDRDVYVDEVFRGRWGRQRRESRIMTFLKRKAREWDGRRAFHVVVEQEPGSGGKDSAVDTVRRATGAGFRAEAVTMSGRGDKWDRAEPFATKVEFGDVYVVDDSWTEPYLREMDDAAPGVPVVDQMDASVAGYNYGVEQVEDAQSKRFRTW